MFQPQMIVRPFDPALDADPALFPAEKRGVKRQAVERVDPHGTPYGQNIQLLPADWMRVIQTT